MDNILDADRDHLKLFSKVLRKGVLQARESQRNRIGVCKKEVPHRFDLPDRANH